MQLNQNLYECMLPAANGVMVELVTIGLGYTAVTTSDGGIGIAATGVAMNDCCDDHSDIIDFEGKPATDLLKLIKKPETLGRTMSLALINALNRELAGNFPVDSANTFLFDHFGILSGARVAMVGYFPPLVRLLEARQVPLAVIDDAKGVGDKKTFYRRLDDWADVLLMTATSIINSSTETILSHAGPNLKTALLGPTTPMIPAAYDHLPIHMLAGSVITDLQQALKIIRHGGGARFLKHVSRKVYCLVEAD